jgi:ABC-type phosphate transport system permease subunit
MKRKRCRTALFAAGEPMIWLTGGSLVICLVMIVGLLALILYFGMSTFWPGKVVRVETRDGGIYMGEITRSEHFQSDGREQERLLFRTGNFRITQQHFQWVDAERIEERSEPEWALVMERLEWGVFYGFPEAFILVVKSIEPGDEQGAFKTLDRKKAEARNLIAGYTPRHGGVMKVLVDGERLLEADALDEAADVLGVAEVIEGAEGAWARFNDFHHGVRERWERRRVLEKEDTGDVNKVEEKARIGVREAELRVHDIQSEYGYESEELVEAREKLREARERFEEKTAWSRKTFARIRGQINEINEQNGRFLLQMRTAGEGATAPVRKWMRLDEIVRAYPANQLSLLGRLGVYLSRWWEYLSDEPREANSEGGVFPAIFGTVLMTLMMALAVVPFGVLAALYLREYARAGLAVSAVRIAVNNLAGVPSIVFGVFGLGFFCYGVGSFIDGGPSWVMPKPAWFIMLGVAAVVGAGAFVTFLNGLTRPGQQATARQKAFRTASLILWCACALAVVVLVSFTPFFDGFYRGRLPNPTFGKGALIWASFTLALMTLPVVIVATEEALSAVPNSMREGSYACGASKWQTIRRIVMPRALPGIMTGMILAMARGAGEVAPLMLVGAVKMAPELPFSLSDPGELFGLNRSFMHLGYHIYDVGFQSQNSEAAKPMVFTTTLLLILIVAVLNVSAIYLRSRLRKRFVESHF